MCYLFTFHAGCHLRSMWCEFLFVWSSISLCLLSLSSHFIDKSMIYVFRYDFMTFTLVFHMSLACISLWGLSGVGHLLVLVVTYSWRLSWGIWFYPIFPCCFAWYWVFIFFYINVVWYNFMVWSDSYMPLTTNLIVLRLLFKNLFCLLMVLIL